MTDLITVTAGAGGDILLPADIDLVRQAMTAYLETTRAVLDNTDWQGPPDQAGSFIKKSGWQKIAKAYRLSTELVEQTVDRDPDGTPIRAGAVIRAVAPNGQHREATGYCATTEPRFAKESGRHKLENDLRNTAATRAENRAISNLCGLGAVSAEEVDQPAAGAQAASSTGGGLPAWAKPGDIDQAAQRLTEIIATWWPQGTATRVTNIGNQLFDLCDATIPACVVSALQLLADQLNTPDPEVQP